MNNYTNNSTGLTLTNYDNNRQVDIKNRIIDVNNDIENEIIRIDTYCRRLENYKDSPTVEGQWWRAGGTSAEKINKALDNFHDFVYNSMGFIGDMIKSQNSNTKKICEIIILLTAAEAKLYSQLRELTTVDQEDIEKLQKLEKQFLQSLENNENDKETVREQFEKLIDYTQAVENVKNKWIRSLEVKINDVYHSIDLNIENATNRLEAVINEDRKEQERSIGAIKEEVNTHVNDLKEIKEGVKQQQTELQKEIDGLPEEIRKLCDGRFYKMQQTLSTAQESFQSNFSQTINNRLEKQDDKLALQDAEINKLKKKSFFDSNVYKVGIGIIAIAALVCSLVL